MRQSTCEKITDYFWNTAGGIIGLGSSLPNAQYAMSAAGNVAPNQVYNQWINFSPMRMITSLFAGASTLAVSGIFGYRFFMVAKFKFQEEVFLFRQRKNTKRFLTETAMALLAAIPGGSIAGGPYTGVLKWGAELLGFSMIFTLSFLGISELIIKLTDEDYAFKLQVIDRLKLIKSKHIPEVEILFQGKELNEDTLLDFLKQLTELHEAIKLENSDGLFREKTPEEYKKEKIYKVGDFGISAILTGCCSFIYIQGGFMGTNVIFNLESISNIAKIFIGIPTALPLAFFVFFTIKVFNSPVVELFPQIKQDPKVITKTISLTALTAGNALWYYSLGKMLSDNENIFSDTLNSPFGKVLIPLAAYLACLTLGINGLAPMLFPININTKEVKLTDVIKTLEYKTSARVLQGLQKNSVFSNINNNILEAIKDKNQLDQEIKSPENTSLKPF